jgi:ADP-ribose pyrophosphatase YjhB (NUDIX family)
MIEAAYNYNALPKKRMAAGALFLDKVGNILIVKPTYRQDWLLPGGSVEESESPRDACIREVKEELNLEMPLEQLLCVEYLSNDLQQTESVQFVFYGGRLSDIQISAIEIPAEELSEYRFSPFEEAERLLSRKLAKRLPYCLKALEINVPIYLEDGRTPPLRRT